MDSAGKDWKLALKWFPQFLLALINPIVRNPLRVLKDCSPKFFQRLNPTELQKNSAILRSVPRGGGQDRRKKERTTRAKQPSASGSSGSASASGFVFPMAYATKITDAYGYRIHPSAQRHEKAAQRRGLPPRARAQPSTPPAAGTVTSATYNARPTATWSRSTTATDIPASTDI